jgi:DNA-directed RNA polymerase subunit RPC12/RpoP
MYTDPPHTSGAFDHPIPQASPCPSLSPYNREMSAFSHEDSEPAYPSVKVESSGWSPQVPYTSVAPVHYTGLPLPSTLTTHMHMGTPQTMAPAHLHPEAYNYSSMYTSPGPRHSTNASDYSESVRAQSEESSHSIYQAGRVSVSTSSTKRAKGRKRRHTDPANDPHRCPHCPSKTFARKYNFDQHMLTHLPDRTKEHPCRYADCGRGFVRKTDLLRHVQSVHEKSRPYQCTRCSKTFARKDTLIR